MAFNPAPSAWIDSYAFADPTISLPKSSLPGLDAAEANASTGDIRKVTYGILEKLWAEWNERAVADRPTKMDISKAVFVDAVTGEQTASYTLRFNLTAAPADVASE